jgi:hypothetical protein
MNKSCKEQGFDGHLKSVWSLGKSADAADTAGASNAGAIEGLAAPGPAVDRPDPASQVRCYGRESSVGVADAELKHKGRQQLGFGSRGDRRGTRGIVTGRKMARCCRRRSRGKMASRWRIWLSEIGTVTAEPPCKCGYSCSCIAYDQWW